MAKRDEFIDEAHRRLLKASEQADDNNSRRWRERLEELIAFLVEEDLADPIKSRGEQRRELRQLARRLARAGTDTRRIQHAFAALSLEARATLDLEERSISVDALDEEGTRGAMLSRRVAAVIVQLDQAGYFGTSPGGRKHDEPMINLIAGLVDVFIEAGLRPSRTTNGPFASCVALLAHAAGRPETDPDRQIRHVLDLLNGRANEAALPALKAPRRRTQPVQRGTPEANRPE